VLFVNGFRRATSPPVTIASITNNPVRQGRLGLVSCFLNIRHFLNSKIEYCGGHIGLGIRPAYRGQKLGNLLMKKSIEVLHKMGINHVHVHCHKTNLASAFAIKNNGGELDSEICLKEGIVQRFIVKNT